MDGTGLGSCPVAGFDISCYSCYSNVGSWFIL